MRRACDVEVARWAARQHTMVSIEQLHQAGLSPAAVKWRARRGWLHPVTRGVYSTVPAEHRPPLAAEAAALLATRGVLSHRSAAAMWGLVKRDPRVVDVTVPLQRRQRSGIRVHRASVAREEQRTKEGLILTSPFRALTDLQAAERERAFAVSEALSQRLISDAQAASLIDAPAITRSEAERRFLNLLQRAGLPRPKTNVRLHGYEVDFHWPRHGVAVEIDGFRFHGHRQAFEHDRRKALALERHGIRVIRLSALQVADEPEAVVASLARVTA
jgi:very-short-patch-repair endonuclease